jgi:hypothetical protein
MALRPKAMSALPPIADMCGATSDVRFGPIAYTGQSNPYADCHNRCVYGRLFVRLAWVRKKNVESHRFYWLS